METIHFLNVNEGDCSVIEHKSSRVSVIDVNNAKPTTPYNAFVEAQKALELSKLEAAGGVSGNFNQKAYPVNPIQYLMNHEISFNFQVYPDSS